VTALDGVGWITLGVARLDETLCSELADACARVDQDDAVRVVVLVPSGPDFSLGLPAGKAWLPAEWPDPVAAMADVRKPVIAGLTGRAQGWGASLALACDVRVAASGATLGFPESAAGQPARGGATQRLTRIVGAARALEVLLLGEPLGARRLAEWGIAARVVAARRLRPALASLARSLAARGPLALGFVKEAVTRALDLPLADGLRLEHDLYVLLQTTADRREGVAAFLERRAPRFRGR
jgi:enoyl-CoA hydratase/carnithine racemase